MSKSLEYSFENLVWLEDRNGCSRYMVDDAKLFPDSECEDSETIWICNECGNTDVDPYEDGCTECNPPEEEEDEEELEDCEY